MQNLQWLRPEIILQRCLQRWMMHYMQGRAADVKDVSERVIWTSSAECGERYGSDRMRNRVLLLADDLAPSETVQLDKSKVLGFATMTWFFQFPYGNSGENDEHSGSHWPGPRNCGPV